MGTSNGLMSRDIYASLCFDNREAQYFIGFVKRNDSDIILRGMMFFTEIAASPICSRDVSSLAGHPPGTFITIVARSTPWPSYILSVKYL